MNDHLQPQRPALCPFLSVVLPVLNEGPSLHQLHTELTAAVRPYCARLEILYVNDGSTDGTTELLDDLVKTDSSVRVLHLSRNFGQQAALHAGLSHAQGDVIVVMDSDLQDNPHDIPRFLEQWRSGYDVVYAIRTKRKENLLKRAMFYWFYRVFSLVADVYLPLDAGNFGLVDGRVAREIAALRDCDRYFPGLRCWVGFRQTGVIVERRSRPGTQPKTSIWHLMGQARTAIIANSSLPLTMFYVLGATSLIVMVSLSAFALYHKLVTGLAVPGWTSHVVTASFFGALNALGIAILGEYVLRIYNQVRSRPIYLINRDSASMTSNNERTVCDASERANAHRHEPQDAVTTPPSLPLNASSTNKDQSHVRDGVGTAS